MTSLSAPLALALKAARLVRRLIEAAATLSFAAMGTLLAYTVWQRYVMGTPSRWSDEMAMILLLWTVFSAAAFVVPYRDQIAVGLLTDGLRAQWNRRLQALGLALAGAILLAALPVTLDYITFLWRERTPALRLPLSKVYLVFGLFQGIVALSLLLRAALMLAGRSALIDPPGETTP